MAFPVSPTNGQLSTVNGITYQYSSTDNSWTRYIGIISNLSIANQFTTGTLVTGNISSNLIPSANVTYNLGSNTNRWKELWISGNTIYIGSESMSVSPAGQWSFTSGGATVELGSTAAFNPPEANIGGVLRASGNIVAAATTVSTSTTTGALVVNGGAGISGILNVGGNIVAASGTSSTSTTTGALVVNGGVGVSGNLNVSGNIGLALTGNLAPNAAVTIRGYQPGTSGSILSTYPKTLFLGGADYNLQYNSGNAVILAVGNYSNDSGDIVYPIYVEDENNFVDFYLFSGNNAAGTDKIAYFGGNINVRGNIIPTANVSQNLGSSTAWWNLVYGRSVQAQYADLAENYVTDTNYVPGTVVVFGGDAEITATTTDHDPRVAGVISTDPAYLMNAATSGQPVALTGRVPCMVLGPVDKGDRLVTSKMSGVAQRLVDSRYTPGCIFAKSLEKIERSEVKLIEVAVGRD
jgi:hypothetical protein